MNIVIRPIDGSDTGDLLRIWNESLPPDAITLDSLESKILLDENFNPDTFLVAVHGETVIGFIVGMYAHRISLGDHDPRGIRSWITACAVDPAYRTRGVGKHLVLGLLDIFRARGKRECYIASYPPGYITPGIDINEYPGGLAFFQTLGFTEESRPLSMDASIVRYSVDAGILEREERLKSEGITIRPYRRSDLLAYVRFMESSMPTDWLRIARRNLRDLSRGLFSTDQIFVVVKDREIIGYCQYEGSHFGPFGVIEAYQGRGIGTVLLARTVERMRMRGLHNAWVMWTDDAAARVYTKLGFTETRRFAVMKRTL
jgi:mycothiol synthase